MTGIVDPAGRSTGLEWTGDFKVARLTEPGGRETVYDYNANGYVTV